MTTTTLAEYKEHQLERAAQKHTFSSGIDKQNFSFFQIKQMKRKKKKQNEITQNRISQFAN